MNTKILQKILDELKNAKDEVRLDYVIGMLETLIEIDGEGTILPVPRYVPIFPVEDIPKTNEPTDEGAILDAKARANVQNIRALAEKGTETL